MKNLAYIAGFFDGEGCIHMRSDGRLLVDIVQRDTRPLLFIQESTGFGKLIQQSTGLWHLRSSHREMIKPFLVALIPFLIVKRAQAVLAIQFMDDGKNLVKVRDKIKSLKKERF